MFEIFTHMTECDRIASQAEQRIAHSLEKLRGEYYKLINRIVRLLAKKDAITSDNGDAESDEFMRRKHIEICKNMYLWPLDQDAIVFPMMTRMFEQNVAGKESIAAEFPLYPTPREYMSSLRAQQKGLRHCLSSRCGTINMKGVSQAFMQKMALIDSELRVDDSIDDVAKVYQKLKNLAGYIHKEFCAACVMSALFKVDETKEIGWFVRTALDRVRYYHEGLSEFDSIEAMEGIFEKTISYIPKFCYIDTEEFARSVQQLRKCSKCIPCSLWNLISLAHSNAHAFVILRASMSDAIDVINTETKLSVSHPVEPSGSDARSQLRLLLSVLSDVFHIKVQVALELFARMLSTAEAAETSSQQRLFSDEELEERHQQLVNNHFEHFITTPEEFLKKYHQLK